MAVALDSDVVIGVLDRSDPLHAAADAAIRKVIKQDRLVASAITFAEVMTGARLGRHDENLVRGFFSEIVSEIIPVEAEVSSRAAELRAASRSLRMPDALIVATADLAGDVGLLLTGDRAIGKVSGLDCEVSVLTVQSH